MNDESFLTDNIQTDNSLLDKIENRQKQILSKFSIYLISVFSITLLGFISTTFVKYNSSETSIARIGLVTIQNPSLGSIVAFLLNVFSSLMLWIFVLFALSFIPYIAYRAHIVSTKTQISFGTKSFRWIQLYSSTLLPTVIFALAWSSLPNTTPIIMKLSSFKEGAYVILGSVGIWLFLWFFLKLIPLKYITIHISILSSLLYISLFIAYGFGYGLVAYSTLFGIFFYLTFSFNKIEEIGRRISIFDIDPDLAEQVNEATINKHQVNIRRAALEVKKQKVLLKKSKLEVNNEDMEIEQEQTEQDRKLDQLNDDKSIIKHHSDIRKTKIEFSANVKDTTLGVFKKRVQLLKDMYGIVSNELDERMTKQIPKKIKELQNNVKNYSAENLKIEMQKINREMESSLEGFPESLKELQQQMNEAVRELHNQTEQFAQIEYENKDKSLINSNAPIRTFVAEPENFHTNDESTIKKCNVCNTPLVKGNPKKGKYAGKVVLICKNCNKIKKIIN